MFAQISRLSLLLLLVLYPTSTALAQPAQSRKDDKLIAELQEHLKLDVIEEKRFESGALAQILVPRR